MESAAHLDVMKTMRIVDIEHYRQENQLLEAVVAMLTKMCDL